MIGPSVLSLYLCPLLESMNKDSNNWNLLEELVGAEWYYKHLQPLYTWDDVDVYLYKYFGE